jgi:hypothetical protein
MGKSFISAEKLIEKLDVNVYPITIVKFLLNRRKIMNYFEKAADSTFELKYTYTIDNTNCENCKPRASEGIACRQHTSIQRVLTSDQIIYDIDSNTCFFKNEIFRMVGNRLVIIYCPHPKLITGEITDSKVRKINPITVDDPAFKGLSPYPTIKQFMFSQLMEQPVRCWFNNDFSILTIPEDSTTSNWCLVPNK